MAIALSTDHGISTASASSTTVAHTTVGAAPSNSRIILDVCYFGTGAVSSISGGGLTWAIDADGAVSGSRKAAICSADAPSGLAAGTTITVTFTAAQTDRALGVSSWTGIKTTAYKGVSGVAASATTTWSSGNQSVSAGSLLIGAAHEDNAGAHRSTPTSPAIELHDVSASASDDFTSAYRIESSAGTVAISGTFAAGASANTTAYVEYLAASGAQTIAVGLNTETDTALAMVASKPIFTAVGLNTETDTALAIVASKPIIAAIGLISEADTALGMTASKPIFQAVGLATEADEALALVFGQAVAVGLVTETDAALAIAAVKPIVQAVGLATEADTALSVVVPSVAVASGRIVLHLRFGPYN